MGNRTILVTTALWLGLFLSLPQTTIAASFVASSVRPPLSNANRRKSLQSSSHRSWLVRKQQSNLSQDTSSSSSSRRLFSTRLVLRQSEDGAADTELNEERDTSARVSQFAFQRSLLEARLAMEAAASKGASTLEAQHVVSEIIAEEKDSSSALQPEGSIDNVPVASEVLPTMKESASVTSQGSKVSKAPTKGAKAVSPPQSRKRKKKEPASLVVEPSSVSVSSDEQVSVESSEIVATAGSKNEKMSPASLTPDPNPESVTSTLGEEASEDPFPIGDTKDVQDKSELSVSEKPTKGAKAVSPSQSRKRKKKEPVSQVVEPFTTSTASDEQASVEPSEIVDTVSLQNATTSPAGLLADPALESVTSAEEASEEQSAIGNSEDVQDKEASAANEVAGPTSSSLNLEEPVSEEPSAIAAVDDMQDNAAILASLTEESISTSGTSDVMVSEEPTRVVSPSQSRKRKEKEPASQVRESTSVSISPEEGASESTSVSISSEEGASESSSASISFEEVASEEPSEIFGMEVMQDEAASLASLIADPTFTSSAPEKEASEEPSAIADAQDTKDEIDSPATQVAGSTSTPNTFEAPASEEPSEEVRAVSPPSKPKKKKREPTYWQTLSREDITSIIVESVTPEKGLRQLNEEADADLLGFAATRLATGLIEGGKAAFFSVKAAAGDKTEETAVAAASKATQKLVSALAAVTALGFHGAGRAQECAQKLQAERIEAAKKAAEARQVEEERNRIEAERVAAEKALVDEAMAAEKLASEEIQAQVEEMQRNVEEENDTADKMAVEKKGASNEISSKEIWEMQVDVPAGSEQLSSPPIFFADEI